MVCDMGCGNGYFVSRLRREYQAGQVIGLDLAEGMLQRARDSGAQAHWLCADAEQLPLADSSVDLLYSNLAVQWCEDLEALARECMRVLRPGGEVLLSTLGPSTLWQLRAAWRMVDRDVHVNRFAVVSELTDHFTRAGAQLHTLQVDTWTRRAATVQQVARELRQIGAHNVNPGRPLGLSGRQRWTRLAEAYASLHDSGEGLPVSWQLCFLHLQKPAVN